jgi:pimeloyl-ACP methyl ester carboxylesterase
MYFEIYGNGEPLVLIHGGGSTINTSFGRLIPFLERNHKVIAVELQNHGHSGHRYIPETFEQDAEDIAALMRNLKIDEASFLGFSNGGTTAIQIAIRYPELVNKLVLVAAAFKREGMIPGFFAGMQDAELEAMPAMLKEAFLEVNPDSAALKNMFEKDRDRMISFRDMSEGQIRNIDKACLIMCGDADVITPEHATELHRLMPHSTLAILPGTHGECIGEITTKNNPAQLGFGVKLIDEFLNSGNPELSV